jgi:hypothetical protein
LTAARAREFVWEWLVGSVLLAVLAAILGTITSYLIARLFWKR